MGRTGGALLNILGSIGVQWAQEAFGTLSPLLTSTAPVWRLRIVQELWHWSLVIGSVGLLLLVILDAAQGITTGESRWGRTVLSAAVSVLFMVGSMKAATFLIQTNNALIASLGRSVVQSALPSPPLGVRIEDDLLFSLPYVVLTLGLALVYLARAAEIMFLVAVAPLGLLCLAWPMARPVGVRFCQELSVLVFVQTVQALLLILSRGLSGLEGPGSPQNGLLGLVVLYVLIRAPSVLRRWIAATGSGASSWATVIRLIAS